jgi:ABC-type Co2+ transport system permease subunit
MDTSMLKRKRHKLTIGLAVLGLVIAVAFALYFETDPRPESSAAIWSGMAALFTRPGSLLFVAWIDIEPQTSAFVVMWLTIALINFALYGGIGVLIGRLRWRADEESDSALG